MRLKVLKLKSITLSKKRGKNYKKLDDCKGFFRISIRGSTPTKTSFETLHLWNAFLPICLVAVKSLFHLVLCYWWFQNTKYKFKCQICKYPPICFTYFHKLFKYIWKNVSCIIVFLLCILYILKDVRYTWPPNTQWPP